MNQYINQFDIEFSDEKNIWIFYASEKSLVKAKKIIMNHPYKGFKWRIREVTKVVIWEHNG